jgi:hypothetical protein
MATVRINYSISNRLALSLTATRQFFFLLNLFCRAELNTIELRPPHMDDSGRTKYPVLFRVYADFCPLPAVSC